MTLGLGVHGVIFTTMGFAKNSVEGICLDIRRLIETGDIDVPALPDIVLRVREAVGDPGRSVSDIGRLIQADFPLAGRLVQVANSPLYSSRRPVDHLHGAVMRLGATTTRNLVESFALRRVFFSPDPLLRVRVEEIWRHSVQIGVIAFTLARITPGLDADRALLAGLVHDIGELALLRMTELYPVLRADSTRLEQVILAMRGEVGAYVLEQWRVGPELVTVATEGESWYRDSQPGPDYCDVIVIAHIHAGLSAQAQLPVLDFPNLPAFKKFPILRFGASSSVELLNEAQQEMLELQRLLST